MSLHDLEPHKIKKFINNPEFPSEILCFDELDSTNEFIKRNMDTFQHGTLAIAEIQYSGKGSRGRSWKSPAGSGIWMSILLKPSIDMQKAPMLTLVMAVSIARALGSLYNLPIYIKWPNDIVCNGRKLCGILTEMKALSDGAYGVVVGIGVNVNVTEFSEELRGRATSVYIETGRRWERFRAVAEIMNCFSDDYNCFLKHGDLSGLLRTYTSLSATVGKTVRVLDINGEYTARAVSVSSSGQLLVESEDGSLRQIFGDEVSVRGIYGYV